MGSSDKCYIKISRGEKRAVVYRPDHPQHDSKGWTFRSRVVWWLAHGRRLPPEGFIIHHVNENTLDDRPENLQAMSVQDHVKLHHQKEAPKQFLCPVCSETFMRPYHIYGHRIRRGCVNVYCSPECYRKTFKGRKITRKAKAA